MFGNIADKLTTYSTDVDILVECWSLRICILTLFCQWVDISTIYSHHQEALDSSGFEYQLNPAVKVQKKQPPPQNKKNRQRGIIWFNPPFSLNVKTNVGKMFLQIIKECFPPTHKLYKICNRNTLKISYGQCQTWRGKFQKVTERSFRKGEKSYIQNWRKFLNAIVKTETKQGVPCQASAQWSNSGVHKDISVFWHFSASWRK